MEQKVLPCPNLPKARNSWQNLETAKVFELVLSDLIGQRRPWSNHAHIPAQYIHELGQLIQAKLP